MWAVIFCICQFLSLTNLYDSASYPFFASCVSEQQHWRRLAPRARMGPLSY